MYKLVHYSLAALRLYRKNKVTYGLVFLGLALAFALNIISGSIVWNALSSDSHWKNSENIYQITLRDESLETPFLQWIPFGLVSDIKDISSDIIQVVSITNDFGDRIHEGKRYSIVGTAVDEGLLSIFDLKEVYGDLNAALSTPNVIALSEEKALEFYGRADPVGDVFELHSQNGGPVELYTVGAVYENPPDTSVWADHEFLTIRNPAYEAKSFKTAYIRVKKGVDIGLLRGHIEEIADRKYPKPEGATEAFYRVERLQGLQAGFLSGKYANTQFISLIIASLFMLLVAVTNYVLISIAMSGQRKRDSALRKVLGANWRAVSFQYLTEALILVSASYFLALVLAELFACPIMEYTGQVYSTNLIDNYQQVLSGWFIALLVGAMIAIYPTSVFMRGKTAKLLRSVQQGVTGGNAKLYTVLISLQAMCGMGLGFAAIVIYLQSVYQEGLDKGFDVNNVLYITVDIRSHPNYPSTQPLRDEIVKLDGVISAGNNSYSLPFKNGLSERKYSHSETGQPIDARHTSYGEGFFDSLGIKILAGRLPQHPGDTGETNIISYGGNIAVNEAFVKHFGYDSPEAALGACIYDLSGGGGRQEACREIKAVVADFHFDVGKNPIEPTVFGPVVGYVNTMIVRFDKTANTQILLPQIRELWDQHFPERVFDYAFVDDLVHDKFKALRGMGIMFLITGGAIIFLTIAGLYAMARFVVMRRQREIAIHRVVGAANLDVIKLVVSQLIKPIVIGAMVGVPVGWHFSVNWLESYTIRITPEPWQAVLFGAIGILIFLSTVSAELIRAMRIRPAKVLSHD